MPLGWIAGVRVGAGLSSLAYLLAVAATVLYLGSILAHELAHAIVARRHGIEVESMLSGGAGLSSLPMR